MAFDIEVQAKEATIEDEGGVVHINDVSGKPAFADDDSPVTWTVCGLNSAQYRKAESWQRKKMRALRGREMTDTEQVQHNAEFIARCSRGFAGFTQNGQSLSFSTETATMVLVKLPFIVRQLQAVMGDHDFFTPGSIS